jgi:integrase
MNSFRISRQPGLFDEISDGDRRVTDVRTFGAPPQKISADAACLIRARSIAPAIVEADLRPQVVQSKRRKRFQRGTLKLESRITGPSVWTYRYSESLNGKKIRRRVQVGTVVEYPTENDAERASQYLVMQANEECAHPNVTIRGLADRHTHEVLLPSLSVPIGGATNDTARLEYTTALGYRNSIRNYILPKWETYPVRDFEKPEVQASAEKWFYSLLRSDDVPNGLAPKSVRQVYAAMGQLCKFAVKWGYLKFNPFSGPDKRIEPPRGSTKRTKEPAQLSPSQFFLLLSNISSLLAKLAVSMAGWLGPRVSEIFGLQWQDLDLELGIVTFRRGFTHLRVSRLKTEASRTNFSIPEQVLELLRAWYGCTRYFQPDDWVFASPRTHGERPFSPQTIMRHHVQPVADALGLPHIGWHTFRHSLSAWTKAMGLAPEDRKTLLRHQSLPMGDLYGHVELERKRKLQNKVVAFVKKRVSNENSDLVPLSASRKKR